MTKLSETSELYMLCLISAVADRDEEAIEAHLEVLASEFGLAGYFGAVVGVVVD